MQKWLQFDMSAKLEFGIEVQSRKTNLFICIISLNLFFSYLFLIIKELSI